MKRPARPRRSRSAIVRKPTIAAISGYAIGGGCGLALACDFRIADRSARMGIPAARLGIVYGTLDCELLYRQVGLANAKRVLFSGQHFAIDDCAAMGLVDMVAHGGRARSRAGLRGGDRRQRATLGRRFQADPRGDCRGYGRSTQAEIAEVIDGAMKSADYREGARAFVEKRRPNLHRPIGEDVRMAWLGVDVGGTFTDLVLFDRDAGNEGAEDAFDAAQPVRRHPGRHRQLGIDAAKLERMVHGTTVATNTVLERNGARMAVLVTAGHKDVLVVGRGNRMADLQHQGAAEPSAGAALAMHRSPRAHAGRRHGARRRSTRPQVDAIGERLAAERRRSGGGLLSPRLRQSRARAKAAPSWLAKDLPHAIVTTSAEVLPEFREYERFSTTALNAYVAPRMRRYLGDLRSKLADAGMAAPLSIMTSNGGSLPARRVEDMPVLSMLSGPAARRDRGVLRAVRRRGIRTSSPATWAAPRPTSASFAAANTP